jgi:hypothetical protein
VPAVVPFIDTLTPTSGLLSSPEVTRPVTLVCAQVPGAIKSKDKNSPNCKQADFMKADFNEVLCMT